MPWINLGRTKKKESFKNISTTTSENGKSIYDNKYWKKLRMKYKNSHPLCELCLLEDRSVPADDIHHKKIISYGKTFQERWNLLLDESNLIALCHDCHAKLHAYEKQHGMTSYTQLMNMKSIQVKNYYKSHPLFTEFNSD